ncbi:MAG TPA: GyrI-like domain-containing protein [Hyphomicrobiales bacterium]|jgi:AraC family transcriptional regulator
MKAALQNHHARMRRVLDHIDRHLDEDLDLDALSQVAAYSKYHFHRQFTATFGLSVHRYIQLARLKRASYRLAYRRPGSPADYSVDLCVGTGGPIEANGESIKAGEIPGGRCAVLRVVGNTDNLEPPALYLYRDWLPASGEELRDFPIYCQRLSFFPEVPEHEAVAEVFLPLK